MLAPQEAPEAREAARLVSRTRDAASRYDFSGTAVVTWTVGDETRRSQVEVHDVDGALEIVAADGGAVIDEGRRTYLRDRLGWTGALVEPAAGDLPESRRTAGSCPSGRPAPSPAGRPPWSSRRGDDGTPAQRLYVDDATGLAARAVRCSAPTGTCSARCSSPTIDIGDGDAPVDGAAAASTPPRRRRCRRFPTATARRRRSPATSWSTRSQHPDGVLLFYSDGVFTASVFEQQGDLDWSALPDGGTDSRLAGTRTRTYHEPSGDVVVWARNGLVYTGVSDAPSDVFAAMVDAARRLGPEHARVDRRLRARPLRLELT